MLGVVQLAVLASAGLLQSCHATPIEIHAVEDVVVDASNTLNSTKSAPAIELVSTNTTDDNVTVPLLDTGASNTPIPLLGSDGSGAAPAPAASNSSDTPPEPLGLNFVNNMAASNLMAYVTGLDSSGQLVMLQKDGTFYHPTCTSDGKPEEITADVAIPLGGPGSTTNSTIPEYISGARVWFAEGGLKFYTVQGDAGPNLVEPSAINPNDTSADVNWGFVELTFISGYGLFADISYVDFTGLPLGMDLIAADDTTQHAEGLPADAVEKICSDLKEKGGRWADLCLTDSSGKPMRILAPADLIDRDPTAFSDFWTGYVDQVWDHFTSTKLTIVTQAAAGDVDCKVGDNGTLCCDGDNRGYEKPTAGDIFGCNSGPFTVAEGDNDVHKAVVPRLCAAFNRGTFLLDGGEVQPKLAPSHYYTEPTVNWYSAIVHKHELDGKGYAFAYDDVVPDGGSDQAGVVAHPNPKTLTVTIGGPAGANSSSIGADPSSSGNSTSSASPDAAQPTSANLTMTSSGAATSTGDLASTAMGNLTATATDGVAATLSADLTAAVSADLTAAVSLNLATPSSGNYTAPSVRRISMSY